jgi:hypothetical protein
LKFSLFDWFLVLKTILSSYSVNFYDWFWLLLAYWTGSNPYFQRFEKSSSSSSRKNDSVDDLFSRNFHFLIDFWFWKCPYLSILWTFMIDFDCCWPTEQAPTLGFNVLKKEAAVLAERTIWSMAIFKKFGPQNTFIFIFYYWFMWWLIYFRLIVFAYYLPSTPSIRVSFGRNLDSKREYRRVKRFSVDHLFSMCTDWWTSLIRPLSLIAWKLRIQNQVRSKA